MDYIKFPLIHPGNSNRIIKEKHSCAASSTRNTKPERKNEENISALRCTLTTDAERTHREEKLYQFSLAPSIS